MTHCTVSDCSAPTSDRLCASHTAELVATLQSIVTGPDDARGVPTGGLWSDLQDVVAGRVSFGSGVSVANNEVHARLPYNATASSLADDLANVVITWCREIAESNSHLRCDAASVVDAAAWLATLPSILATHIAADELHDEITDVVRRVTRAIDRPAARTYVGVCGAHLDPDWRLRQVMFGETPRTCDGQLYAHQGAQIVVCSRCGASWDVHERRAWLLGELDDRLVTQPDLRRALVLNGQPVKRNTLGMWISRGRLVAHARNAAGAPLYRIGDAIDLAVRSVAAS